MKQLAHCHLQDLGETCTTSWSMEALGMPNGALAPSTWWHYQSSLVWFHDYCWQEEITFPPTDIDTTSAIANFLEEITRTT